MRRPSRPILALLLLLGWLAATSLTGRPPDEGDTLAAVAMEGVLRQVALAALLLALAALALRWRGLGLRLPRAGSLRLLWLPALYLAVIAAVVAMLGLPPAPALAFLALNMLLVGLSEELMFRGVLYSGLRDRFAVWPAALLVSGLFGAVHVLNVLATGHLQAALLQSVAAAMLGLLLLALRLRTGSLWTAVVLHASWNFGLLLVGRDQPPPPPDVVIPLGASLGLLGALLPIGLYGAWLLRPLARSGDGLG